MAETEAKIAVVLPSLAGGGCERMVAYLLPELCRHYRIELVLHQDTVAYPLPPGLRKLTLGLDTSAAHRWWSKLARMGRRVARLRRVFDEGRYDLIFSCIDMNNVVAWWANRGSARPAPLIAVEQTVCPEFFIHNPHARKWRPLLLPLLRLAYGRATRLVALSASMRDYLRDGIGISRETDVIYNGIDPARFFPAASMPPAAAAAELASLPDEFRAARIRLVNVGRLDGWQKNQEFLISLFPRLAQTLPGCQLFFLGDGPDLERLRGLALATGLAPNIHFLGWQADTAPFLRHADALLHAARYETFGNTLVEAMACGVPVVTTNCGAVIPELLDNGRRGSMVTPEAPEAYLAATQAAVAKKAAVADPLHVDVAGASCSGSEMASKAAAANPLLELSIEARNTFSTARAIEGYLRIIAASLGDATAADQLRSPQKS